MIRLAAILAALAPAPAIAHPHIFIDTGLEMIVDEQGRLTHIRVSWTYDAFYSLLITEDMGLDPDYDGVLTEAEEASLTGFDMRWIEGYNGDLEGTVGGVPLVFSGPKEPTASFADGKITTTHLRAVEGTPVLPGRPMSILPYDATFYTAYEVRGPIKVTGLDACLISTIEPDIDAELAALQQQLLAVDANSNPSDAGLPNAGRAFATEVKVTCAAS